MPDLESDFIHLGLGATAIAQPEFADPMAWYADYAGRTASDGAEGRLVSQYSFHQSWDSWEMHPAGDEVVICTAGEITLIREQPGGNQERTILKAGEYAINLRGTWHTADVHAPATAIFITAGMGTQHRPR
jgi:hypothetical protein